MRVLNISYDDYANFAYDNAKALESVGVDAVSVKRVSHAFNYEGQSGVYSIGQIKKFIDSYDIIQFMHSYHELLDYAVSKGKRCFVYHTGTSYRQDSETFNKIFNNKVERCFTDQCEFFGLGMKNETYIATAINTDRIKALDWNVTNPYTIAHFPSNPSVKGTQKIGEMLSKINSPYKYIFSQERVNHSEQIKRMSQCDIYIELFAPTQNGKPYGCFGVTAFEAAAMGKLVFTNNLRQDVYWKAYGISPFVICNTEADFMEDLEVTLNLSHSELKLRQQMSAAIIEKKHSYKATGEYLLKLIR